MKNLSAPRRLAWSQFSKLLGLPNQGELQKLRVKCQREGQAFPVPGPDGFLESDVIAFKKARDTIAAQAGNAHSIAPHQPISPLRDRRANTDRRQR